MMLSVTAKTNICTVLAALVNAGGVRPEDQTDVTAALTALQEEVTADEAKLADLETRVAALEDLDNGEEQALGNAAGEAAANTSEGVVETSAGASGAEAATETAAAAAPADETQTASVAAQSLT